jgi:hypothetical protein
MKVSTNRLSSDSGFAGTVHTRGCFNYDALDGRYTMKDANQPQLTATT